MPVSRSTAAIVSDGASALIVSPAPFHRRRPRRLLQSACVVIFCLRQSILVADIVNLKKGLAKSRGRNTMGCQPGLTLQMPTFDKPRSATPAPACTHMRLDALCAARGRAHAWQRRSGVNVERVARDFSKILLSSLSEPCSIRPLSKALCASDRPGGLPASRSVRFARQLGSSVVFLSCGRPVTPVAIRGCLSSSSLPPSFARGRRTTVFYSGRVSQAAPATSKRTRRQA